MEATSGQEPMVPGEAIDAIPAATEPLGPAASERGVEVSSTMVHIHDLCVERPAIVKYLESIAPGKQEIALIHALEVGITELAARRARFRPA